jgi:hypothetical protein
LSKLTFTFSEPLRFRQTRLSPHQLRLTFPNTTSAKYVSRTPIIFKSGHAKSLSFDFSRDDTIAVIVTLNENVQYDVRKPQGKPEIVIDMYPFDTTGTTLPETNIASLVKHDIESVNAPKKEVVASKPAESVLDIQLVPLMAALVFSVLGTTAMMYRLNRPSRLQRVSKKSDVRKGEERPAAVEAILEQAKLLVKEKAATVPTRPAREESIDESDDATMTLARTFGRAQGEVRLARKLEAKSRAYMWEKKLQSLNTQRRDSLMQAKKLGVGRGEMELADSFRKMRAARKRKEPRS